ncbi:MAG TPA: aminoglycoside adenylyltransferase domain-containing protein [Micromonospora sp.]
MTAPGDRARAAGALRVPAAEADYLRAVLHRLRDLLGDDLLAVYPTGSLALAAYTPGRSDIDLMAVVADDPGPAVLRAVAARLAHSERPCPAAGLEFVLDPRSTAVAGHTDAGYLLDLNTGRDLPAKASLGPGDEPGFWYPIDRAVTWQADVTLAGPSPRGLLRPVPFAELLPVVAESVRVHRATATDPGNRDNAVLNAARAWCFAVRRQWYAKPAAARWAADAAPEHADLLDAAAASHAAGRRSLRVLPADPVTAFLDHVSAQLAAG